MANINDNDLEELDFGQEGQTPEPEPEKKPGNRNFIIALGAIGLIFVLITIALIVVAVFILPGQSKARQQASALTLAANTATAQFATDQAQQAVIVLPATATTGPTSTKQPPTNTPVVAPTQTSTTAATIAPSATAASDAQKATLSAQQTQLASGKFTATVIATSTALPNTGFADEVGLPALLGLGAALILIVFLARRLRTSPVR